MSLHDRDWYRDREYEDADARAEAAMDLAERLREPIDPLVTWSEADRVLARERAEALRRVSEPVCAERIRPARDPEDGLSAARGIALGLVGGLAACVVILAVAHVFGVGL